MFDVIIKNISSGDSCRALVPVHSLWGKRASRICSPGAMLLVDVNSTSFQILAC